jgi:hypothetical protein
MSLVPDLAGIEEDQWRQCVILSSSAWRLKKMPKHCEDNSGKLTIESDFYWRKGEVLELDIWTTQEISPWILFAHICFTLDFSTKEVYNQTSVF